MEIKNLKKAAQRIITAAKRKEKIIIYGDADLDGVSSVIILKETIKNLGGNVVAVYFPDRENEGYGINEKALKFLKEFSPALFLTLDCGISNFKEVKLAKKMGFEVVIVDHHQVLDELPKASIIVDPKQKGDKYYFKGLATAGIVFKLCQLLLKDKLADSLRKNFLELVALATLSDMMPREDENKAMIEEGLFSIENSWRPGIKVFFEMDEIKNCVSTREAVQKIISALNIVEMKGHLNQTYLVLSANSQGEAEESAREIFQKVYQKQAEIKEIVGEIEERISRNDEPIIFEGDSSWPLALAGSAASRICQRQQKTTFIFKKGEKESRGAVRTPSGIDGVEAMKHCSKLLITFGGHAPAAGFTIKNENLEKFKDCLMEYFRKLQ